MIVDQVDLLEIAILFFIYKEVQWLVLYIRVTMLVGLLVEYKTIMLNFATATLLEHLNLVEIRNIKVVLSESQLQRDFMIVQILVI